MSTLTEKLGFPASPDTFVKQMAGEYIEQPLGIFTQPMTV